MLKLFGYLLILMSLATLIYGEEEMRIKCDLKKCPEMPKHYQEMKCIAINATGKCCPIRYECPNRLLQNENCFYRGKSYGMGEKIPGTPECFKNCECAASLWDPFAAVIRCAMEECPDTLNRRLKGCVREYSDLNKCCAGKYICDEEMLTDDTLRCKVDGKDYRKGELMYPKAGGSCMKCMCDENFAKFNNMMENPSCKRMDCGMELMASNEMRLGCMPVYMKNEMCCPMKWRCPEPLDVFEKSEINSDDKMKCRFGNLLMNMGDKLIESNRCMKCACTMPPMAQCIMDPDCDPSKTI